MRGIALPSYEGNFTRAQEPVKAIRLRRQESGSLSLRGFELRSSVAQRVGRRLPVSAGGKGEPAETEIPAELLGLGSVELLSNRIRRRESVTQL